MFIISECVELRAKFKANKLWDVMCKVYYDKKDPKESPSVTYKNVSTSIAIKRILSHQVQRQA